jgi:hypothetical protein
MKEYEDINKAKQHIDGLLKLGKEIQDSTPYLVNIRNNLDWCNTVYGNLEDKRENLIEILKGPVMQLSSFNYSDFTQSAVTGFTGAVFTATADTSTLIRDSDQKYHFLLEDLSKINPIEKTIENISTQLELIDIQLFNEFKDVRQCYFEWLTDLKSNSDLAKDARTFQEHFYGILNKLRVPKKDWKQAKIPKISWNRIASSICKKGTVQNKSFLRQQKIGEEIKVDFNYIMKKTKTISKDEMGDLFKRFIEHTYAIINLIDYNIIHQ